MKLYFLYNPHILEFIEHVEEVITPVRNELMASEIVEQTVRLIDHEHTVAPHIPDMYEQNLLNAAKFCWAQEQSRHPSYSTFHDPVRFQLVMYSLNGLRFAQCHTSHRGESYYEVLETLDDIAEHTEEPQYPYLPQRDTSKIVYDLPGTLNPMIEPYTTPEFYEQIIALQPQRDKRLLEHIKNEVNGKILHKRPNMIQNSATTGATVDIMALLRTVEEVIDSVGTSNVLSYGNEPKVITVQDLMSPVKKTVWSVDNGKIDYLADMVLKNL